VIEWYNPTTGETIFGSAVVGGSTQSFQSPYAEQGVLHFIKSTPLDGETNLN
jgi:hypothetical protein